MRPDEAMASRLAQDFGLKNITSVKRMTTGNCHFVYEVVAPDKTAVVRIAVPENRRLIEGAIYWNDRLKKIGVPLPVLFMTDSAAEFPFMIMERVPGRDLGEVYPALSDAEKRALAVKLQAIQADVNKLPMGSGYGYLTLYEIKAPYQDAMSFNLAFLNRTRAWFTKSGIFDESIVDPIEMAFAGFSDYFKTIKPVPFLHDITTKNVLISEGRLSGIVDVDDLCFGDSLKTIALTYTSLLSSGYDTRYIDYWREAAQLSLLQERVLALYTAECAACFLSEIGQAFNKSEASPLDMAAAERLAGIINQQLGVALGKDPSQFVMLKNYMR